MMRLTLLITALVISHVSLEAQTLHLNLDQYAPEMEYENIHVQKLDDDSLASTFVIWVKKDVKTHFHEEHSEVVWVIEGEGEMQLGDKTLQLKPGDYVFIPRGTHHSVRVTSEKPMKVLSVQTPQFDGSDRHFVSQE